MTDVHVKGVERLHLVELVFAQIAFTQRGHAQIDEGVGQPRPTVTAATPPFGRSLGSAAGPRAPDGGGHGHERCGCFGSRFMQLVPTA